MKKSRSFSLYRRIVIFFLLPLAVVCITMVMYLQIVQSNVQNMALQTFQNMASNRQEQLSARMTGIQEAARSVGYSTVMQNYLLEKSVSKKVSTFENAQVYLQSFNETSPYIISASAMLNAHSIITARDSTLHIYMRAFYDSDVADQLQSNQFLFTRLYRSGTQHVGLCFYAAVPLYITSGNQQIFGSVIYQVDQLLAADAADTDNVEIFFQDGRMICSSNADFAPDALETMTAAMDHDGAVTHHGKRYYLQVLTVSQQNDTCLAYLVACDSLLRNSQFFSTSALMITAASTLFFAAFMLALVRSIFHPLKSLTTEVSQLAVNGKPLSMPPAQELALLARTINEMLSRIDSNNRKEIELRERNMELQLQKNRMELQAFRHQINPHFLFNTLECISSMVRYYHIEPVTRLIMNLSACFHYSLHSPITVPLRDEVAHLTHYLEIIEERFPGKYRMIREMDDSVLDTQVPSLLLQPLAENAITHGFTGKRKKVKNTLVLKIASKGNQLHIDLIDNGVGMSAEKLASVQETMQRAEYVDRHISLNNVHRRLYLLFHQECMELRSVEGCYTRITVVIPLSPIQQLPPADDTRPS